MKKTSGASVKATDGQIGKVKDFYFDDVTWTIRYLVTETGGWLSRHSVLLSPHSVDRKEWTMEQAVPVSLTMDQVRDSPDVDMEQPVSRQQEMEMAAYYGWPSYWALDPMVSVPLPVEMQEPAPARDASGDPHLRSYREVRSYEVAAPDGMVGKIADMLVEDSDWKLFYLAVTTGEWLNSRIVLVPVSWIRQVSWEDKLVTIDHERVELQDAPDYPVT